MKIRQLRTHTASSRFRDDDRVRVIPARPGTRPGEHGSNGNGGRGGGGGTGAGRCIMPQIGTSHDGNQGLQGGGGGGGLRPR